jgi:hypothetical protein
MKVAGRPLHKLMKRPARPTKYTTLIDAVRATVKADLSPEKPSC